MAMMGGNRLMVDTNILVYASLGESMHHETCVAYLKKSRMSGATLVASRQILREFMAVMSRPRIFSHPVTKEQISGMVEAFQQRMAICDDTILVTTHLLQLFANIPMGGKQIHDANIVATMQAYDIPTLVTYNLSDFYRFKSSINLTTPSEDFL